MCAETLKDAYTLDAYTLDAYTLDILKDINVHI